MGPQLADLIASGEVKVEMQHFPLQERSLEAVKAVECAGDQGFWWAMHNQILENQSQLAGTKNAAASANLMKQFAKDLGLETAAFNQCVAGRTEDHKYVKYAVEQAQAGAQLGVQGTPSFLVNGELLRLQTFDDVLAAVKKELGK